MVPPRSPLLLFFSALPPKRFYTIHDANIATYLFTYIHVKTDHPSRGRGLQALDLALQHRPPLPPVHYGLCMCVRHDVIDQR